MFSRTVKANLSTNQSLPVSFKMHCGCFSPTVATTATSSQTSQKIDATEVETETFTETFSSVSGNYAPSLASPTGFEPVSPA